MTHTHTHTHTHARTTHTHTHTHAQALAYLRALHTRTHAHTHAHYSHTYTHAQALAYLRALHGCDELRRSLKEEHLFKLDLLATFYKQACVCVRACMRACVRVHVRVCDGVGAALPRARCECARQALARGTQTRLNLCFPSHCVIGV